MYSTALYLCKIPANFRNEEADKTAKRAIDMPGMISIRLPYIDGGAALPRI